MPPALKDPTPDPLQEMEELLRSVASGTPPNRFHAVKFTQGRATLMSSDLKDRLPGFMTQCLSVYKFAEFITLYHPRVDARLAFLDNAFRHARASSGPDPIFDAFGNDPF